MPALFSRFITSCVEADGDEIHAMQTRAIQVSYRTFATRLGFAAMKELRENFGYDENLKLQDDWAVSFYRSKYQDERVYYMQHSRIEYIYGEEPRHAPPTDRAI